MKRLVEGGCAIKHLVYYRKNTNKKRKLLNVCLSRCTKKIIVDGDVGKELSTIHFFSSGGRNVIPPHIVVIYFVVSFRNKDKIKQSRFRVQVFYAENLTQDESSFKVRKCLLNSSGTFSNEFGAGRVVKSFFYLLFFLKFYSFLLFPLSLFFSNYFLKFCRLNVLFFIRIKYTINYKQNKQAKRKIY